jgi:hypothetical protein
LWLGQVSHRIPVSLPGQAFPLMAASARDQVLVQDMGRFLIPASSQGIASPDMDSPARVSSQGTGTVSSLVPVSAILVSPDRSDFMARSSAQDSFSITIPASSAADFSSRLLSDLALALDLVSEPSGRSDFSEPRFCFRRSLLTGITHRRQQSSPFLHLRPPVILNSIGAWTT